MLQSVTPSAVRPKKTNIVRSRTGCKTCRRRKLKCDEQKPECKACLRRGIECEGYAQRITFRDDTNSVAQRVNSIEELKWEAIRSKGKRVLGGVQSNKASDNLQKPPVDGTNPKSDRPAGLDRRQIHTLQEVPHGHTNEDSNSSMTMFGMAVNSSRNDPALHQSKSISETSDAASQLLALSGSSASCTTSSTRTSTLQISAIQNCQKFDTKDPSQSWPSHTQASTLLIPINDQPGTSDIGTSQTARRPGQDSRHTPQSLTPAQSELAPVELESRNCQVEESFEHSYLMHWEHYLVPQLPGVFKRCQKAWSKFQIFRNTALLLASADVAPSNMSNCPGQVTQPHTHEHRFTSLDYYSKVLQNLSKGESYSNPAEEACVRLAVLLLIAFFEMGSGTFKNSVVHVKQMDELIAHNSEIYKNLQDGRELISAWAALRAQLSCDCTPWDEEGFPRCSHTPEIKALTRKCLQNSPSRYEVLMPILDECSRLTQLVIVGRSVGSDMSSASYRLWIKNLRDFGIVGPPIQLSPDYPHALDRLRVLSLELDAWHDCLDPMELPYEGYTSKNVGFEAPYTLGLHIKPLHFHSVEAAMNYLLYAFAQLLCSKRNLDRYTVISNSDESYVDPWALLILRTVAGVDAHKCVQHNAFRVGILWILSKVALFCASAGVAAYIELWLHKAATSGIVKEASMPMSIIIRYVRKIRSMHDEGQRMLFMHSNIDGESERFDLYSDSTSFSALVYGLDKRTGELFDRIDMGI